MNPRFKTRLDDIQENDPTRQDDADQTGYSTFEQTGHIRNLVFILADKQEYNCQYSYLVNTKFNPEQGTITFTFTDQTIMITGSNLNKLHKDLRYQLPEEIRQTNPRYAATVDADECIITEIAVISRNP